MNRRSLSPVRGPVALITMVSGILLMAVYLSFVRLKILGVSFDYFVFGVILCSFASLLSFFLVKKHSISLYSILCLYILSYGLLTLYSFRYSLFGGTDIIGEFTIASNTLSSKRWPIELMGVGKGEYAGRYAGSLSVTIFPAVLSEITGIDMLSMFRYVLPGIGALVPVVLYVVVKEVFEDRRIAFLSALLFSTSHVQIFESSYIFKQQFANLFLLLSVYALLKLPKHRTFILLFLPSIIFSHYTVADYAFIIFLGFLIAPYFLRKKTATSTILSPKIFIYYCVVMFSWLVFIQYSILSVHTQVLVNLSSFLLGRQYFAISLLPGNPIIDGWYYLTVSLVILGCIYAFFKISDNIKKMSWITSGTLMLGIFLASTYIPMSVLQAGFGRIFVTGNLMFSSFLGLILSVRVSRRRVRSLLGLFIACFILFSIPMNMSLIDHQRILDYHPSEDIAANVSVSYHNTEISDLQFARWISSYVSEKSVVSVDYKGFMVLYLANHVYLAFTDSPILSSESSFMILDDYYLKYGFWIGQPYSKATVYPAVNVTWTQIARQSSVVYSNGKMLLLMRNS